MNVTLSDGMQLKPGEKGKVLLLIVLHSSAPLDACSYPVSPRNLSLWVWGCFLAYDEKLSPLYPFMCIF